MSRRKIKQELLHILSMDDLCQIRQSLDRFSNSEVINPLFSALCSTSEMVKWHAVTAFGWIVPAMANKDFESARIVMRRFLWSLNDESGGIGWGAPEAMAEIMAEDERLADEYIHMLISYMRDDGPELFQDGNYLELPMLQRGLLWGVGRLCFAYRERMQNFRIIADLQAYLTSSDGTVRGLALWALAALGDSSAEVEAAGLKDDTAELSIYWQGYSTRHTVGEMATRYLQNFENVRKSKIIADK